MSKPYKLKWRVGEKATGRYRSFHKRSWPTAEYANSRMAARIGQVDGNGYEPRLAEQLTLMVYVADYVDTTFHWRRLIARPVGVRAAKAVAQEFIDNNFERLLDNTQSIVARKRD